MRQRVSKTEERLVNTDLKEIECSLRKAAEVHKEVRSYVQAKIRPGMRYWDICCDLEDKVRLLIGENGPSVFPFCFSRHTQAGMGFPTGVSPNNVAAHYTPNPGDSTVLQYHDVVKLDFGTEVNGRSAFHVSCRVHHRLRVHDCVRSAVRPSSRGHTRSDVQNDPQRGSRRALRRIGRRNRGNHHFLRSRHLRPNLPQYPRFPRFT